MDEQIALAWIGIGVALILAILIYRLANYIILKRRWRRSFKRMEWAIARATETFNQVIMATNDTTAAAKRFGEIVMTGFMEEVGFQCGHWINKNLPKFIKEMDKAGERGNKAGQKLKKKVPKIIKETEKNERTRKDGDGRTSQGEPTKH